MINLSLFLVFELSVRAVTWQANEYSVVDFIAENRFRCEDFLILFFQLFKMDTECKENYLLRVRIQFPMVLEGRIQPDHDSFILLFLEHILLCSCLGIMVKSFSKVKSYFNESHNCKLLPMANKVKAATTAVL